MPSPKITKRDISLMRKLRSDGCTYTTIAERFGVTRALVWYYVNHNTRGRCRDCELRCPKLKRGLCGFCIERRQRENFFEVSEPTGPPNTPEANRRLVARMRAEA